MKKLLTVTCLAGLLSIPSVVFAEASWYGSIRAGVSSNDKGNTGVSDSNSRWGIRGSSEVSEGLTAVYRFETRINATNANQQEPNGRLSYVGLSGGFGTITVGQVWSASYNSFGAITDNSFAYGDSETSYRVGDAVSYAVSVGNVSLQADVIMDSGTKKTTDAFEIGATLGGLMETGSIAIAHKSHRDAAVFFTSADGKTTTAKGTDRTSSNYVAGQYGVGGMTVYLGVGQEKAKNAGCKDKDCKKKKTNTTTFAGVHGDVGDTGVNYIFQMRSKKSKSTTGDEKATSVSAAKTSPWILGLSRSLGGGASVHFEHGDPDSTKKSSTGAWLKVDF